MSARVFGYTFGRVPEWLLDSDVSAQAIRLFALLSLAGDSPSGRPVARWVRRRRLAERMRCSFSTVDRTVRELIEVGAVEVVPRLDADGGQLENDYRLFMDGRATAAAEGGRR